MLIQWRYATANEDIEILTHVNSKNTSATSHIHKSNQILEVEGQLPSSWYSVAEIYDKVLRDSDGPLNSQS